MTETYLTRDQRIVARLRAYDQVRDALIERGLTDEDASREALIAASSLRAGKLRGYLNHRR